MSRPSVPAALKRRLFEEAGYRCAVPTCRATSSLQMEHIEDWAKVGEHTFDNMIVLCANCHARVTSKEISKEAIRAYKRNLAIVNGRYSLFEIRLIQAFFEKGALEKHDLGVALAENDLLHIKGLIDDILVRVFQNPKATVVLSGLPVSPVIVSLTDAGRAFVSDFFKGEEILT